MTVINEDVTKAIWMELRCVAIIPVLVTMFWQFCLYIQMPVPWLIPMLLMTAFHLASLYLQCTSGFSTLGIYFRMIVNGVGFIYVLLLVTILFLFGFTTPEHSSSMAMLPYTYAISVTYCCVYRVFIMLVILSLRSAGAGV